jgi:type VI secretion system secreted protein VgrG
MENVKVKIGGEDYTARFSSIHIQQDLGWHHYVEIRLPLADTIQKFKGVLNKTAKDLIGKALEISFEGNKFKGIVVGLALNRVRRQENELIVTGGSPTLVMDEGPDTVSFYEQTLKQIADSLINKYANYFKKVTISPGAKEKIKYIVKYKESTYEFLNRIAAQYGEWFYFDGEEIFFATKPVKQSDKVRKLYQDKNLLHFDLSLNATPVNFKLSGYDYKQHQYLQEESSYNLTMSEFAKIAFDKSKSELYKNSTQLPVHSSLNKVDLGLLKDLRERMTVTELVVLSGSSTDELLRPGMFVHLLDERTDLVGNTEDYGEYILTRVEHSFDKQGENYFNSFEAVPSEVEVPPFVSPLDSPYCEMQLADIVENNDPDAMGRVRVQFLWQRGTDQKSPWIRMGSPYSGKDKGFYVVPEKGDQVLVAFENNSPNRPYVLTGLYNGDAKPENHHSENNLKSLKTRGGHVILMNDEKGKENFGVTSPKDVSIDGVAGKITLTSKELITIQSQGNDIKLECPGTITIHSKDIILNADSKISLNAPTVESNAGKEFKATSPTITIEGQENSTIKGGVNVNIEGTLMTNITGGTIKLN